MATKDELKQVFVTGAIPTEEDFHSLIDVAGEKGEQGEQGIQGEKGDPGAKGADGAKGDKGDTGAKGADGADGFGTEAQYNDIISRLEALENAEG